MQLHALLIFDGDKMTSDIKNILITLLVIIAVFSLIFLLDRKVTKKGSLFTKTPSKILRILATIMGLVFLLFFGIAFFVDKLVYPMFVILGGVLIGYGFNFGSWFVIENNKQLDLFPPQPEYSKDELKSDNNTHPHNKGRIGRFVKTFSMILAASIGLILVSLWAASHQDNPFSEIIVIGVIVLYLILMFGKGLLLSIMHIRRK
jgi:hypothetical protein